MSDGSIDLQALGALMASPTAIAGFVGWYITNRFKKMVDKIENLPTKEELKEVDDKLRSNIKDLFNKTDAQSDQISELRGIVDVLKERNH